MMNEPTVRLRARDAARTRMLGRANWFGMSLAMLSLVFVTVTGTAQSTGGESGAPPDVAREDSPPDDDEKKGGDGEAPAREVRFPPSDITATRLSADPFDQPYAFYRHDRLALDQAIGRTALDRINYGPGVFIQHTAPNQTSPFIRGLTGEQTLLMIDGVRLSHAFMRPGPNQYAAMVPDSSIQSIDVILGSSSVVNGSDGLTGALDFQLTNAGRDVEQGFSPWVRTRVDVANGAILQGGFDGRHGDWAFSVDVDLRDFHDRVGGKDFEDHVFGAGVMRYDEIPNTSYDQIGGGVRIAFGGFDDHLLEFKSGYTQQNDAPRPDGYFENTGIPSRISRSFDPQTFSYVHLRDTWQIGGSAIDRLQTTVWWHRWFEDETREEIRNQGAANAQYRRREREDRIDAYGLDLQATTYLGSKDTHELTWGVTGIFENTDNGFREFRSPSGSTNPYQAMPFEPQNWGNRTTVSDDSDYWTFGVFVQDSWDISDCFNLLAGARYSYYDWSFGNVDGDASDFTGSLRGLVRLDDNHNVFVGFSKAFRAPNLTNLDGAVDRGSSGTPAQGNPDLDPEISYTAELGWRWRRGRDQFGVTGFYTFVDDLIQPDFAGSGQFTNIEDARLMGFEVLWDWAIPFVAMPEESRLALVGSVSLVDATKDIPQPGGGTNRDNLSRANRFYGRAGVRYEHDRSWWGLFQVRFHDAYDDVATDPSDPDSGDIRLTVAGSPDGSMPGYGVCDFQLGWRSEDGRRDLTFFVENLFDKTYREPGSGVDGPGRNVGVAAGIRF